MGNDNFNSYGQSESYSPTPPLDSMKTKFSGKQIIVIFIVDSSMSMEGTRIGAVNGALAEVVRESLRSIKASHNLDIKVAIMSFANNIRWELTPTPLEEVDLPVIKVRPGVTLYGAAFNELSKVLRKDRFMAHSGKIAAPAIIFMTDGEPDSSDHYEDDLRELMSNGWFRSASRFAILIGDAIHNDIARQAVAKFVNDPLRDVVAADDSSMIMRQINLATMHTVAGNPIDTENNTAYSFSDTGSGFFADAHTVDPFSAGNSTVPVSDSGSDADPFGDVGNSVDPFSAGNSTVPGSDSGSDADPFSDVGNSVDPFSAGNSTVPASDSGSDADPFGDVSNSVDPFSAGNSTVPASDSGSDADPFGDVGNSTNPFGDTGGDSSDNDSQTISFANSGNDTDPFAGFV